MNALLMLGALFAVLLLLKALAIPLMLIGLGIACIVWPSVRFTVFAMIVGLFTYALYVNWAALAYYGN